jgi:hypothetical protein
MFNVTLETPNPGPEVLAEAVDELALVLTTQSRLRRMDLFRKRDILVASRSDRPGRFRRLIDADLRRAEASLLRLTQVEATARTLAVEQLDTLRRCLGGLVAGYDIGGGTLGVRLGIHGSKRMIRMLLLSEPARRMRVQLQAYGKGGPPPGVNPARPVCLGQRGDAYTDWALDSMHLPTLVLTLVSYVRTNGSPNEEW